MTSRASKRDDPAQHFDLIDDARGIVEQPVDRDDGRQRRHKGQQYVECYARRGEQDAVLGNAAIEAPQDIEAPGPGNFGRVRRTAATARLRCIPPVRFGRQ